MIRAPLSIISQLARSPLPVTGEQQVAYLLLEVSANDTTAAEGHPPINLGIMVDRSGSMRGPRMTALKDALITVIDVLTPQDTLSVVTFDDMVDLVVPAQPVIDRAVLKGAVSIIEDGGGTSMSLGMSLGLAEMQKVAEPDRVSRAVLVTDGVTRGDELQCEQLAQAAAHDGVPIAPMGIGAEWDDAFLDRLSTLCGGPPPEYIRFPTDLPTSILRQVASAQATARRGVTLCVRFVAGVTPRRVTRVAPFTRPTDDAITDREVTLLLGDIEYGVPQRLLIELLIEPKRSGTFRIAQIETNTLADPDNEHPIRADVVVPFSASASQRPKISPVVLHYIERATATRLILGALESPEATRMPLAPNILRLFDREGRDLVEALWARSPLPPEGRKALYARIRDLTSLRRVPVGVAH